MDSRAQLLAASCRVGFAALVHDVGKFFERTGEVPPEKLGNVATYCPSWEGRHSHQHAAYTGMAIDAMEKIFLPPLKGTGMTPFEDRDSVINGAAMHHKPETPLQRIIATADRLASGFERESFDRYNRAGEDEGVRKANYRQVRLWPLLETLKQNHEPNHRLPLHPLAPEFLYPVSRTEIPDAEAKKEYQALWTKFLQGLERLERSPRWQDDQWPLWLDHFDSLYLTFTHAIPSATVTRGPEGFKQIPPNVSLYDHSKATASLAVALWRHHEALGSVAEGFAEAGWQGHWDRVETPEFLLVQGDFCGIQEFIFSGGGASDKGAAKMLRGRSFEVSLLTELAALKVLEAFELPGISQIINAAGKFLIVAPCLPDAEARLERIRRELDPWFLTHAFGQGGIVLASTRARRSDFQTQPFKELMERLFRDLDRRKRRRFDLCGLCDVMVFDHDYAHGVCSRCGQAPAMKDEKCARCAAQLEIGDKLVKERLLRIGKGGKGGVEWLGYRIGFGDEDVGFVVRAWDLAPAQDGRAPLWNGRARREINGHVPKERGEIRTFEEIAGLGVVEDAKGTRRGVAALGILKGDVDDLGTLFKDGLQEPTFARMASLSRQLNAFFTTGLAWHCARKFPDTYTVFAGGDDFFLVGPWWSQMRLAREMQQEFQRYVGNNPEVHFSAGVAMTKPGIPVPALVGLAEAALHGAKKNPGKKSITCWKQTVDWHTFGKMLDAEKELHDVSEGLSTQHDVELSTAYLYGLLRLCEMAGSDIPEDAIWRSWFTYRTWRFVVDKLRQVDREEQRQEIYRKDFAVGIGGKISQYKEKYKIALFAYLYKRREVSK
ncbi:MAG: type III-A CRISPR-associated protein Cas10/Csm1 [Magnetococcales bacterium]|nr:type III-A CRISPR-associated protein Cas10/Csm1 [Magnetococcales bacterium]